MWHLAQQQHPWYWAWRSWRASTWTLLLWSALLWPTIVSIYTSDELFSGELAFLVVLVWLVGVGVVFGARALADRAASRRRTAEPLDASSEGSMRKAFPFIAAAALAGLLLLPLVTAWTGGPTEVESAVKSEWEGRTFPVEFGIGLGESETIGTGVEIAKEVECEETEATVNGARVHRCTIAYCDHDTASFLDCPDTTLPACAALVSGRLVMVSETKSVGPPELHEELLRTSQCPG